jgi:hypothetical protein
MKMRYLILVGVMMLGSLSVSAFAEEQTPTVSAADNTPQCMTIQVDGKATKACFNLSDEQVQNLGVEQGTETQGTEVDGVEALGFRHHCELRCLVFDHFGRCRQWHRVCW